MKILVVDDEPHIVKLIKSRLEANSYTVVTASDGQECLQKIVSEKPDLVILDIMMPKMDGYSVLVALKEMLAVSQEMPDIPVVVLTARVDERIKSLIEQESIKGYLVKPFDSKELLKTIENIICP